VTGANATGIIIIAVPAQPASSSAGVRHAYVSTAGSVGTVTTGGTLTQPAAAGTTTFGNANLKLPKSARPVLKTVRLHAANVCSVGVKIQSCRRGFAAPATITILQ
jgi:hypothetical protein